MKRLILTAAVAALISLPSVVSAQTSTGALVCVTAKTGEMGNAAMGAVHLSCQPVDVAKVRAAEKTLTTMMAMQSMTPDQIKAMQTAGTALGNELHIPMILGTGSNDMDVR